MTHEQIKAAVEAMGYEVTICSKHEVEVFILGGATDADMAKLAPLGFERSRRGACVELAPVVPTPEQHQAAQDLLKSGW